MRFGISSNAGAVLTRMKRRKEAVTRELSAAARTLGAEVNAESKKILQSEIYSVPIPLKASADRQLPAGAKVRTRTTKGKHGRWQRTGALKRRELFRADGPSAVLTNDQNYAAARYTLGTPQSKRRIRTPGVRSVQWQAQAVRAKRQRILEVRRQAILRALSGGSL